MCRPMSILFWKGTFSLTNHGRKARLATIPAITTRADAAAKILAAYDAGCRRFDSATGGLGGCPFAQDELVGNIPTETVIETLRGREAQLPALKPLDTLLRATV